jgi:molecular chaperone DnaK
MLLGQVDLTDIPPAPAGIPKIKVEFNINSDGIVEVTAKDLGTNKEIKAEIEPDGGLSDSDVERMLKDAQTHAEEDKKRKEAVETANFAEALVTQTQDALDKYGDQLPDDAKQMFEAAVKELNEALENEDEEKIKELTEGLTEALPGIGEIIYGSNTEGEENDATDASDVSNDNKDDTPANDSGSAEEPKAQDNNKKKPGGPQPG